MGRKYIRALVVFGLVGCTLMAGLLGSSAKASAAAVINYGYTKTLTSSLVSPTSIAVDKAGNLYVVDPGYANGAGAVLEMPKTSGGYGPPVTLPFPGLSDPSDVAVDAGGDVYAIGEVDLATPELPGLPSPQVGLEEIGKVSPGSGRYTAPVEIALNSNVVPYKVALDSAGNPFVLTGTDVVEVNRTTGAQTTLPYVGLTGTDDIAVDSSGDVLVLGTINNRGNDVIELPKTASGWGKQTTLPFNSIVNSLGLAVDTKGDIFVAEAGTEDVIELPKISAHGYGPQSPLLFKGLGQPQDVAVDNKGDVFVADMVRGEVVERVVQTDTTSPSITALPKGGYEVAFEANTGKLWTTGSAGRRNWGLGMMPGTSPSIAALPGGGYEVAFEANTGKLWTTGSAGTRNWGLGMMSETSPSIAALAGGGYEVAFEANTAKLWTATKVGGKTAIKNWGLGMYAGTNPAITGLKKGGVEIAFQANTGDLWIVGNVPGWRPTQWNSSVSRLSAGPSQYTNPSIAPLAGGKFEYAVQYWTGQAVADGWANSRNWPTTMMPGTSPSIAGLKPGGFEVAFQADTGKLWTVGNAGNKNWGLGMLPETSPSITGLANGGYEVAFQANTAKLWTAGTAGIRNWGLGM